MKTILNKLSFYLLGIVLLLSMTLSCSESFLDKPAYGNLDETAYLTGKDAPEKLVTNCYRPMLEAFPFVINKGSMGNQIVDDADKGGSDPTDRPQVTDLATGRPLASNVLLSETWKSRYKGIMYCNDALLQLASLTDNLLSVDEKARYMAEIKFLRAFYYFDLVSVFKSVPLLTQPMLPEDKNKVSNASIEEIRSLMLADLDAAIKTTQLPMLKNAALGRVNKEAAYAFKARVCLFFAGLMSQSLMTGDALAEYGLARDAAKEIVEKNQLALLPDYQTLFRGDYIDGTVSSECIFTVIKTYNPDWGFGNDNSVIMNTGRNITGGWGGDCPTVDLSNHFDSKDPRRLFTILSDGDIFPDDNNNPQIHNYKGYDNEKNLQHNRKFFIAHKYRFNGSLQRTRWSPYYIRYADVLLMYAEALIQTGGNLQTATDLINEVRYRAFVQTSKTDEVAIFRKFSQDLTPINDYLFTHQFKLQLTDQVSLLKALKNERRSELAMEGLRFVDLIRWGDYVPIMTAYSQKYPLTNKGKFVTNKSWPFPIPQSEIDLSGGRLIQNSNYR